MLKQLKHQLKNSFHLKIAKQNSSLTTVLVVLSMVGMISYVLLAFVAPFKGNIFNVIFQKPSSNAQVSPSGASPLNTILVSPAGVNQVDLTVSPSTITTDINQTFTVSYNISTGTDQVSAVELHMTYDPTKLQAQSITQGTLFSDLLATGVFDNAAGTASITLGSGSPAAHPPVTGTGTMVTMTFKTIANGSSVINYDPNSTLTASVGKSGNTLSTVTGAGVTAPSVIPTPSPTAVPTAAPTAAPTATPTIAPTATPTFAPTATPVPTPGPKVVNLSIAPATLTTTVNQTFTTSLNINPGTDQVTAAEIHISFDPTKLQAQSITQGTLFSDLLATGVFDNALGTASITLGSGSPAAHPPVTTTGTMATITFKALTAGSTNISYANSTLTASIGKTGSTLNTTTGNTITINPAPTPTSTITPVPTSTPLPTPQLIINNPTNGGTITGSTVNVSYSILNNSPSFGVAMVHLTLDNNPTQMDMTLGGAFTFNGVTAGAHTLTAFLAKDDHTPVGTMVTVPFTTIAPPVPCTLGPAMWETNSNPVQIGTSTTLRVFSTGDCDGQQIHYHVSTGGSAANIQPLDSTMVGNVTSSTWIAERNAPLIGDPQYLFTASVVGGSSNITSDLPDLAVTAIPAPSPSPTAIPTIAPTATPTTTPAPTLAPTPSPAPSTTPTPGKVVNLTISPATVNTTTGQNFSLALNINPGTDQVSAVELHLTYDPTKLQAQSITQGTLFSDLLATGVFDNALGTASITLGSGSPAAHPPVTTTGTMATITFKALTAGSTNISYANSTLTASIGKTGSTLNSVSGATVTATGVTQTPVPTTTPAPTSSPIACSITSANWNPTSASQGQLINLNIQTSGSCDGQKVVFVVRRNVILGLDEDAVTQPVNATIKGNTANGQWTAEWKNACILTLTCDPDYFFKANIVGQTATTESTNPRLLTVSQTAATTPPPPPNTEPPGPPAPQPPGPPTTSGKVGDLNNDGLVNITDLSILLRNWNKSGLGDLNNSGKVDILDLSILLRNWSK